MQAGDIIIDRIAIHSDIYKNKVAKLSYCIRVHYQIICIIGCGSHYIRKINKPDSPELMFMAYGLYALLYSFKPCKPLDTADIHYLNQTYALLLNP